MKKFGPYVSWFPANLLLLVADRHPEAKKLSEMAERQMTMERKREIARQDMARTKARSK